MKKLKLIMFLMLQIVFSSHVLHGAFEPGTNERGHLDRFGVLLLAELKDQRYLFFSDKGQWAKNLLIERFSNEINDDKKYGKVEDKKLIAEKNLAMITLVLRQFLLAGNNFAQYKQTWQVERFTLESQDLISQLYTNFLSLSNLSRIVISAQTINFTQEEINGFLNILNKKFFEQEPMSGNAQSTSTGSAFQIPTTRTPLVVIEEISTDEQTRLGDSEEIQEATKYVQSNQSHSMASHLFLKTVDGVDKCLKWVKQNKTSRKILYPVTHVLSAAAWMVAAKCSDNFNVNLCELSLHEVAVVTDIAGILCYEFIRGGYKWLKKK